MNYEKSPLISFIVSVYNLESYLADCLDSILNQPFYDYEIVLVNNSSTDGSDAICREYAEKHRRIRYFSLTGEPVLGRASIYGIKRSRGDYIQFVDADDMLAPNAYGEIERVLKTEMPDVVFGRFETLIEAERLNATDRPFDPVRINLQGKEQALAYLAEAQPFILAMWLLILSRKVCWFLRDEVNTPKHIELSPNLHFDVC